MPTSSCVVTLRMSVVEKSTAKAQGTTAESCNSDLLGYSVTKWEGLFCNNIYVVWFYTFWDYS